MTAGPRSRKRKRPTFIEEARRQQIIEATIDTVASIGFAHASLSEIAKVADISKTVIPYYFGTKDDLVQQTLDTLHARSDGYVGERVSAKDAAADKLRAYIVAQLEYVKENRRDAVAEWEVMSSFDSAEAKRTYNSGAYDPLRERMARILRQGQESGEFRDFPVPAVASTILGLLDGIILQWTWDKDAVDLDACCQQALAMVEAFAQASPAATV